MNHKFPLNILNAKAFEGSNDFAKVRLSDTELPIALLHSRERNAQLGIALLHVHDTNPELGIAPLHLHEHNPKLGIPLLHLFEHFILKSIN